MLQSTCESLSSLKSYEISLILLLRAYTKINYQAGENDMSPWLPVLFVYTAGCLGGLVNALISGELHLPRRDHAANVYRRGWVGNVVVGGVAAVVFWGMYGRAADATIVGGAVQIVVTLRMSELFGAIVTGIGGGRLLTSEASRIGLMNQKDALERTKRNMADVIETSLDQLDDNHERTA